MYLLACLKLNTHQVVLTFDQAYTVPGATGGELVGYIVAESAAFANDSAFAYGGTGKRINCNFGVFDLGAGDVFCITEFLAAWFPGKRVVAPATFTYF